MVEDYTLLLDVRVNLKDLIVSHYESFCLLFELFLINFLNQLS